MKNVISSEKTKIPLKDGLAFAAFVFVAGMTYSEFQNFKKELADVKADVRCLLKKTSKLMGENCTSINPGPYAGR